MDHSTKQTIADVAKTVIGVVGAIMMTIVGIKKSKRKDNKE